MALSAQEDLAQADRCIAAAKEQIVQQKEIVEGLAQAGHTTELAESLLHAMEQSLHAYEHHREVVLKRLVAGVDFAPPEPMASVLPRIQLTSSQADELWALLACKGRRRNPNNNADAEMAKEIFGYADLANAVQSALEHYVRHDMFLSDVPKFRRTLKARQDDVARFLATLPQEHDAVGYFLKQTYTGEIFLRDQLRPTHEKILELQQAWSEKHGVAAIRNNLAEYRKNIDAASSLLSGTKPRNVAKGNFVGSLAHAWEAATGQRPKSGRDDYKGGRQSGPFADFVRAVNEMLPSEYRIRRLDHAIR